jgi:DNA-binding NarL/FixJ family response regulator
MTALASPCAQAVAAEAAPTIAVAIHEDGVRSRVLDALARGRFRVEAISAPHDLYTDAAPDVLVVHSPRGTSDELLLLRGLKRRCDGARLVVVCHAADGRSARRTLDAGVDGLIFADGIELVLLPTISAVMAGQTVVPSQLRSAVIKPSLSFREKQILGLVAVGLTNRQIGSRLFLAESTVKSHLSSVFTKLGVRSRSEAAGIILDPHDSLGLGILQMLEHREREPTVQLNRS